MSAPLRFRWPSQAESKPWHYGVYFPETNAQFNDMGLRRTGKPEWEGIEWLDNDGGHDKSISMLVAEALAKSAIAESVAFENYRKGEGGESGMWLWHWIVEDFKRIIEVLERNKDFQKTKEKTS